MQTKSQRKTLKLEESRQIYLGIAYSVSVFGRSYFRNGDILCSGVKGKVNCPADLRK